MGPPTPPSLLPAPPPPPHPDPQPPHALSPALLDVKSEDALLDVKSEDEDEYRPIPALPFRTMMARLMIAGRRYNMASAPPVR